MIFVSLLQLYFYSNTGSCNTLSCKTKNRGDDVHQIMMMDDDDDG